MPLFKFNCKCGKSRRLLQKQVPSSCVCECGLEMERSVNAPSTSVKEVIDTGTMTKPLERYADATRLFKDRAEAVEKERG